MLISAWVRSSQIARWRSGQLAAALVFGSPGHAATLAVVSLVKRSAPADVKLMFTPHVSPCWSMAADALAMSSPVSPVAERGAADRWRLLAMTARNSPLDDGPRGPIDPDRAGGYVILTGAE